ncbi:class I SAM-dependent methyltransferase [Pseudobacteriovorax antillogorgiicola]|uniref:Methyltransferase domain-containing protein n=1 Tax=Pseudobacteriovorax antillogorgiicola TaxID=1513793 RepID=A0A1Y6CR98_9BACT|nr:class I SAM-dependent methyltransferase [Pseudobacteriovorax antillogorgiicola]TCS46732.1 methyltransferase family protein [Pseudobacteriovorax antillogorgiicola]SMF67256.1 Methyltransferase domain-containing protein [Pseudobacteriovorax antillogorgiicola]
MLQHSEFNGLKEKAAPGTHQAAWQLVKRHGFSADTSCLDLAAGNGAFTARFVDSGFTDLSVSELHSKDFKLPVRSFFDWDLNQSFSSLVEKRYGLVTAIEIIEHLDSPLHFLREIHNLLDKEGHLLLTTPNVQNVMSRLKFLLKGELKSFSYSDFIDQRHIHGITDHQIKIFFEIVGFEVVHQTSAGSFYSSLKKKFLAPVQFLMSKVLKGYLAPGDVNIYLVRKTSARSQLSNSLDHYMHVANEIS